MEYLKKTAPKNDHLNSFCACEICSHYSTYAEQLERKTERMKRRLRKFKPELAR